MHTASRRPIIPTSLIVLPSAVRCALAMEEQMRMTLLGVAMVLMAAGAPRGAAAAEIKVLTAGAFKQVLLVLVPDFEKQTGHKVILENDTVGALTKRIEGGEAFDLAVLTPAAVNDLSSQGQIRRRQPDQSRVASASAWWSRRARQSRISARSTRSRRRCSQPSRLPISIPPPAARAASMSPGCSTSSGSPQRSSRRPS